MSIRGIFHPSSSDYPLVKSLGFSHIEIAVGAWPGRLDLMNDAINKAHATGLSVIIEPGLFKDLYASIKFLQDAPIKPGDIIMLADEPNLFGMPPALIIQAHISVKEILPNNDTMISLSWVKSYSGFENSCDIVAFDFYRKFFPDLWTTAKLIAKVQWFKAAHGGQVMAIPGIKYGAAHIKRQAKFWKLLDIKDFFWYSFTPDQEVPKWFDKDLAGLTEIQKALSEVNGNGKTSDRT
ncbi:MAG: hypothetical protein AAB875_07125 [Patescibacteria group bacterium]